MKIFNLKSKTSLVGWSLLLGFIIHEIILKLTLRQQNFSACTTGPNMGMCPTPQGFYGWPFTMIVSDYTDQVVYLKYFLLNLLFWILVAFIVLSLVRWFRNKTSS